MSYPHRNLTLFHTLSVDAITTITLAAGWKVEEAGKKRLFAMGLPIYQALVRPIHDG